MSKSKVKDQKSVIIDIPNGIVLIFILNFISIVFALINFDFLSFIFTLTFLYFLVVIKSKLAAWIYLIGKIIDFYIYVIWLNVNIEKEGVWLIGIPVLITGYLFKLKNYWREKNRDKSKLEELSPEVPINDIIKEVKTKNIPLKKIPTYLNENYDISKKEIEEILNKVFKKL